MTAQHTKEPWWDESGVAHAKSPNWTEDNHVCCHPITNQSGTKDDCAHACACVNACEGINPKAVPDLLAALQDIAEHTNLEPDGENYRADDREGCLDSVFARATAAIAKAKPQVAAAAIAARSEK